MPVAKPRLVFTNANWLYFFYKVVLLIMNIFVSNLCFTSWGSNSAQLKGNVASNLHTIKCWTVSVKDETEAQTSAPTRFVFLSNHHLPLSFST